MQSQPLPVTPREIADARSVIANASLAAQLPDTVMFDLWCKLRGEPRRPRPAFRPKFPFGAA